MLVITADKETLLPPLQCVTGIVERRHTLPILANVLLQRSGKELTLTASDLEMEIRSQTELPDEGTTAALTVSARKLHDIVRALPDGAKLLLETKDSRLAVNAGKSRFTLQMLPAENFPALQVPGETAATLRVSQRVLRGLLEKVQFSMAQQDIRYYLNGMLFSVTGDRLILVATDGHRLSYASEPLPTTHERVEVILPRKSVNEVLKLLAPTDDPVQIKIYANQVKLRFANVELTTKVIDGKYPDYTRVIPTNYHRHFQMDRAQFLQALQRVAILSTDKVRGVRLLLTKDSLGIICTNSEQEEAQETLDITYNDEALDIGFNISYLVEVLGHLDSEQVDCACADVNSGILFTIPGNPDFKHVVMPMRI
jgi:DNA polymerase III subunit beta